MQTTDADVSEVPVFSFPNAFSDSTCVNEANRRARWDSTIDQLIDWGRKMGAIDDDGMQSPTTEAIAAAFLVVNSHRMFPQNTPPHRIVADGEGGIAIEWQSPPRAWSFDVLSDGRVEVCVYRDSRLDSREWLSANAYFSD